jgi:tetratricopeptide (TPR) repeat protein
MKHLLFVLALATAGGSTFSQTGTDRQKAQELKEQAVQLMDNADVDKAISLLSSAQQLDASDHTYLYEKGYAYYIKKDLAKAIVIFRQTTTYPDVTDQCYQMLGNAYDDNGQRGEARDAYNEGLKKFPNAGRLYLELGTTYGMENDYDHAVSLWEKGVEVQPDYPSNYYRLANMFASTDERIWAVFYGELFMNIERGSGRTKEISKLLFNVYKKSITLPSDTSRSLKLDMTSSTINLDPKKTFRVPFRLAYTMEFLVGLVPPTAVDSTRKELTISMLSNARVSFIDFWFNQKKSDREYPNILLDFQRSLYEQGLLEAYNYWLLSEGNKPEFEQWRKTHQEKYDAFVSWFTANPLKLDAAHKLLRTQYDQ